MNYHNIKSHKKSGFHSASTKHIFEKIKLTPEMSIKYLKSVISLSVLSWLRRKKCFKKNVSSVGEGRYAKNYAGGVIDL